MKGTVHEISYLLSLERSKLDGLSDDNEYESDTILDQHDGSEELSPFRPRNKNLC